MSNLDQRSGCGVQTGTDISPYRAKEHKKAHESGIGENSKVKAEVIQLHNIYSLRLCQSPSEPPASPGHEGRGL